MRLSSKAASLDVKAVLRAPGTTVADITGAIRTTKKGLTMGKRFRISDAFRQFIWATVPKIEESIEEKLLRDLYHKIPDQLLREELLQAYTRRRYHIESKGFHEEKTRLPADDQEGIYRPNFDVTFPNILDSCEETVGEWVILNPSDYPKIFPNGSFGNYRVDDLERSKVFGLALMPESNTLISLMKNVAQYTKTPFKMAEFLASNQDEGEFQEAFAQLENYQGIYRLLSEEFRLQIDANRSHSLVYHRFADCFLADTLIHVLMKFVEGSRDFRFAMALPETRNAFFTHLMQAEILKKTEEDYAVLMKPEVFVQELGTVTYKGPLLEFIDDKLTPHASRRVEIQLNMRKFAQILDHLPAALSKFSAKKLLGFNSSVMLHGSRGVGKSGILNFVTTWAWHSKWIVLKVPSAHRLTQVEKEHWRHEDTRLFIQQELALEILQDLITTNKQLLEQLPVDLDRYGFFNVSGCHINEPKAVQNVFDEWTQTHLYDSDKLLMEGELQHKQGLQRHLKTLLKEKLPAPRTVLELASFAEKDPEYVINVLAEVIEQLQHQDKYSVLTAVDDYNWFFRRSIYRSFRYDNKVLKAKIPPYHLALCRMLMRMDGHKYKSGFKVVASSHYHLYKHVFNPTKINYPEGFDMEMKGMKLDHLRAAVYHYTNTELLQEKIIDERIVQQFFSESQGNWSDLMTYVNKRHLAYDFTDFKLPREKALQFMKTPFNPI